jgi:hypothetical protein
MPGHWGIQLQGAAGCHCSAPPTLSQNSSSIASCSWYAHRSHSTPPLACNGGFSFTTPARQAQT